MRYIFLNTDGESFALDPLALDTLTNEATLNKDSLEMHLSTDKPVDPVAIQNSKDILAQAKLVANNAQTTASNSGIGTKIKDALYSSSTKIQDVLNKVFANKGIITQDQVDALDEQMRIAKLNLMAAESNETTRKTATYIVIGIAVLGTLYWLSKK